MILLTPRVHRRLAPSRFQKRQGEREGGGGGDGCGGGGGSGGDSGSEAKETSRTCLMVTLWSL